MKIYTGFLSIGVIISTVALFFTPSLFTVNLSFIGLSIVLVTVFFGLVIAIYKHGVFDL